MRALVAFVLALCAGCAAPALQSRPLEPIGSPAGFALVVHGIWPDGWWVPDQALALRKRAVEPIPVEYTSRLSGYIFGFGTDRPAAKIIAFARALEARHAATACAAAVRLHGIGYSGGTMVLLKAAEAGVALDRVYYGGSPLPLAYGRLEDTLAAGRFGRLVNYCSPLDGIVGITLGCGAFGFHGEGAGRVENRGHLRNHLDPIFGDPGVEDQVAREIAASAAPADPRHTCFEDPRFAAWFLAAERRLTDEDAPPEPPAPRAEP